jgi:hypothetical protein
VLAGVLTVAPAQAQNPRSFVSPTGSDAAACTLAAPCRTFAAAYAATNASGEIAVLGTAGYGALTITKAISIVNPGGFEAGITVPSGGIGITITAGTSDAVSLRGLSIDGAGVGTTGIRFDTGKSLTMENCVIRHVTADGIDFFPNATSSLSVSNSKVLDNGSFGIVINPTGSGAVTAVFNHVEASNNANTGITMQGHQSTGTVKGSVYDTVAEGNLGNGFGLFTQTSQAPVTLMVFHSVAANNGVGLQATGLGTTIRAFQTMVTGNTCGWTTLTNGVVLSYGNNAIDGNGASESAPTSVAQK